MMENIVEKKIQPANCTRPATSPRVSVVIPTYNRPHYLKRAIDSVLKQTFKDYEIIVVQNGGTESSKELVYQFIKNGAAVRYLYERKADPVNARNVGVTAAKGEYIAFLDDDDVWYPQKLEMQIAFLDKNPNIGLVTSKGKRVDDTGRVLGLLHEKRSQITFESLLANGGQIVTLSSVMVRKVCFDRVGLMNSKYIIANDYEFYLRLTQMYEIGIVQEPLFNYYWHSQRTSGDVDRMFQEASEVLNSFMPKRGSQRAAAANNHGGINAARYYYFLATEAMDWSDYANAAQFYLKAIQNDPFVGVRSVLWSRYNNLIYRFIRPYGAMLFCWLKITMTDGRSHKNK